MWNITKEGEYWLELEDPDGWYSAVVKWDGCVHFYKYFNIPLTIERENRKHPASQDYLHICDIDSEIERLLKLKEIAVSKFGEEWARL